VAQGTWREFEVLVGEYFHRQGFTALDNGGGGPDGGVDVLLQKGSDKYLVQCKQWRALRVGVQPVRELYGVMSARRVAGGFVVTSGEFTQEARSFAEGREIQLINGKTLQRGIQAQAAVSGSPALREVGQPQPAVPAAEATPDCPLCNAPMVLRLARQGAAAGKQFWGCSRFGQTKCRGTRELG
jgi:restriction system protein